MSNRTFDDRRGSQARDTRRRFLARGLASVSILAATTFVSRPVATPLLANAQGSNQDPPLLVTADWLEQRIASGEPGLVLLDLGDLGDYRNGHLPGAVHSFWLETVERDYTVYGTVLNQRDVGSEGENQGKRIAWIRRHGIGPGDHVVAYDHGQGRRAGRIVWFLRFLGYPTASMLDGGAAAWRGHGFALETSEITAKTPAAYPTVSPQDGFYVSTSGLERALAEPGTQLVDIRTDEERHDTVDGQFPTGVIPGSLHLPWTGALRDDQRSLLDPPALRTWAEEAGLDPQRKIILYGQFGCDTNLPWLALHRGGFLSTEVYDRGWAEWASSGRSADPLP